MTNNWYEKTPPHLVAVGQGAREYIEAERCRLEKNGEQVLNLTPETAINLTSRFFSSAMQAKPLFVLACETVDKTMVALCELIAKRGRIINVHLLAACPEPADASPVLRANAQVLWRPA